MKSNRSIALAILPAALMGALIAGCSTESKSPDVTDRVRTSLSQNPGLKDVTVSEDRDKGVVTLAGNVASDSDKAQAESIVKSAAGALVVADQIAVRPPGNESMAKDVDADLDKAIAKNLDAALLRNRLNHEVSYDVKRGVVTLTGTVKSDERRARAERLAQAVPNVKQVVNELDVKGHKATSTD